MLINRLLNGKLNLDASPYRTPPADYFEALNITRDAQGDGQDMVVSNVNGNRKVSYTLHAGTNKEIGSFTDPIRNRIYYFIWNSNGYNFWLYYDKTTDTIVKVLADLTDTGGVAVLAFNPSKRINHIDVFYRDTEGDLHFFTDGNTTPKCANVQTLLAGTYGTIKSAFIELAKMPPLAPPTATYGNDATKTSNALRRKLFQPACRWQYDDFQKSTFSPYGKVPLPVGLYGSDNDLDSSNNNFITITVETGDKDVMAIEILVRSNIGDAWGDFYSAIYLNKADLNISDNSTYQFLFYNDALYPPVSDGVQYVDGVQVVSLFDWCPPLCDCLVLANGNIPVVAAITEGFPNYPVGDLDVTMTAANVKNSPPDTNPPAVTYTSSSSTFNFTVSGAVPVGTSYKIYIFFNGNPALGQTFGVRLVGDYTSIGGDTISTVAFALYSDFNSYPSVPVIGGSYVGNTWQSNFGTTGSYVQQIVIVAGSTVGTLSTEKTWMWGAQYIFGQVYEDEQNRDMPGVTTYANPTDTNNDFVVSTPEFSLDGTTSKTPVISASINHLPMAGSKKFNWVRRRQTYGNFILYMTCDYQEGTDDDTGFLFLCLDNINAFKTSNSQFIYGAPPISPESRIKVIAGVGTSAYNGDIWNQDYQILGVVTRTLTGGTAPDDDRQFIKITKPVASLSPAYTQKMVVMVYTPALNPTSLKDSVYYEWGENYGTYTGYTINYTALTGVFVVGETVTGGTSGATGIVVGLTTGKLGISTLTGTFTIGETITGGASAAHATLSSISSGVLYHKGMNQDQTSFQPATYTFSEGDVYYRNRAMYSSLVGSPPYQSDTVNIMDANYSDYFDSAVNDNGRAHAIEVNAQKTFNPAMVRFAEAYQSGTNINGVNRFYFENFDEYDRRFGSIRKLFIDKRYMDVYQQFDIGVVPVLTQIVKDTAGNPLEANSDILLNKIMYPYEGQFGIGDVPESFAYGKGSKYFIDNNKGVVCRISANGVQVISVLYECNNFFVSKLAAYKTDLNNGNPPSGGVYTGNPTCYGIFDSYTNKYIIAMEEINRYNSQGYLTFHQDANTISFLETRSASEGFESPLSYHPEGMQSLDNLLVTFKNGEFWKHDSSVYCNFYGTQYVAYITPVFNDNILEKKSWMAITQVTDTIWECPIMYTNVNSYNGQRQETALIPQRFKKLEQYPSAAIMRDIHSTGGVTNGSFMKGSFMVIRFQKTNANELITLTAVSVLIKDSPLTVTR